MGCTHYSMGMASNHYEFKARAQKVEKLYRVARRNRLSALDVATKPEVRSALVTLAGVNSPSDASWKLLVSTLAKAEAADAPFAAKVA